jgi:hypothetical protein
MATPKNTTQRASARVAPKPGSAESIRRQTARLTELLDAAEMRLLASAAAHYEGAGREART